MHLFFTGNISSLVSNITSPVKLNSTENLMFARLESEESETTTLTISPTPEPEFKKISIRSTPNTTYGGFKEVNTEYYYHQREMALNFLKSQRRDDFGWGDDTPRALVAYLLSSVSSKYEMTDEHMLIATQLDLKLLIALAR